MSDIHQTSCSVSGTPTPDEYDEAVRAAGLFRGLRTFVFASAVVIGASSVSLGADGASVDYVPLAFAAFYAALGVALPRVLTARSVRAGLAAGERRITADGLGLTVSRGGETSHVAWGDVTRHRETPRLHVVVGRSRGRKCMLILPKRQFDAPDGSERFAALIETRAGAIRGPRKRG